MLQCNNQFPTFEKRADFFHDIINALLLHWLALANKAQQRATSYIICGCWAIPGKSAYVKHQSTQKKRGKSKSQLVGMITYSNNQNPVFYFSASQHSHIVLSSSMRGKCQGLKIDWTPLLTFPMHLQCYLNLNTSIQELTENTEFDTLFCLKLTPKPTIQI